MLKKITVGNESLSFELRFGLARFLPSKFSSVSSRKSKSQTFTLHERITQFFVDQTNIRAINADFAEKNFIIELLL